MARDAILSVMKDPVGVASSHDHRGKMPLPHPRTIGTGLGLPRCRAETRGLSPLPVHHGRPACNLSVYRSAPGTCREVRREDAPERSIIDIYQIISAGYQFSPVMTRAVAYILKSHTRICVGLWYLAGR